MKPDSYLDFDLKLAGDAGHGYYVEVIGSPLSIRSNPLMIQFPKSEIDAWKQRLKTGGLDRILTRRLGERLFQAIFQPEVLSIWQRSISTETGRTPRVRLDIRTPELAAAPWEIMHDGICHLAMTEQIALVRYAFDHPEIYPVEGTGPLNILLLVSTPVDVPPLPNIEREMELISESFKSLQVSGQVGQLDVVRHTTRQNLQRQLRHYQVLHYMGHGAFDDDNGYLIFEDEDGRSDRIDGETLSYFFTNSKLRLLFLNSCQTAIASQTDSLLGVAQAALVAGVPAVVAMQEAIFDKAAATFASEFYRSLAEEHPVEFCMVQGRLAVMNKERDEWAIPVLFSNAHEGRLWVVPEKTGRVDESAAHAAIDEHWTINATGNDNIIGKNNKKTVINYLQPPKVKRRDRKS